MRSCLLSLLLISQSANADISRLGWLAGCWAHDDQEQGSGEYWLPPAGDSMLAVSRTVRESKTVSFEFLRIKANGENTFTLFAMPSGQPAASFDMILIKETEIVFENPNHDFPQRIIYRLVDDDTLVGRIEGKSDGQDIGIDFPMTRVDCENLRK